MIALPCERTRRVKENLDELVLDTTMIEVLHHLSKTGHNQEPKIEPVTDPRSIVAPEEAPIGSLIVSDRKPTQVGEVQR